MLISIIAGFILFFSFIGGFSQGAVKSFFSLLALFVAIPIAGLFYHAFARLLGFLPGQNWENLIGFFIVLGIASIILHFIFFLPRKIMENIWHKGLFFRLIGGFLNLLGAAISLVILTLVISAYPAWTWLEPAMNDSGVIIWVVNHLTAIQSMLPEVLRSSNQTRL
jgi:uncharacterized membrane protein required for colicin V production